MTLRVTNIAINKLFGYLNHAIDFPIESDFIILYGANGVGKTTVLRIVNSLFSADFDDLASIAFGALKVTFEDGSQITAISQRSERAGEASGIVGLTLSRPGLQSPEEFVYRRPVEMSSHLRDWLEHETTWRRLDRNLWQDISDGEILPEVELVEMFGHIERRPVGVSKTRNSQPPPPAITEFLEGLSPIFVATDRLATSQRTSRSDRLRTTQTVARYATELRNTVRSALTKDARLSQELDRTFPRRLLDDDGGLTPTDDAIRDQYDEQNRRRAELRNLGLISGVSEISLPEGDIEEWKRRALALFLKDAQQRLSSFDDILPRVSLFHEMVNSRFVGKRIRLSDSGLEIVVDATNRRIQPTMLSSGEQHELILTYDLIFKTRPGQLILIDEPEISLHAAWQLQFLEDMRRIFALSGSRAIIATHSPQIVDQWTNRMVALTAEDVRA